MARLLSGDKAARAPANDIQIYSDVHATGNSQLGGVQLGFLRPAYQEPGGNKPPVAPAEKQASKKIKNNIQNITKS